MKDNISDFICKNRVLLNVFLFFSTEFIYYKCRTVIFLTKSLFFNPNVTFTIWADNYFFYKRRLELAKLSIISACFAKIACIIGRLNALLPDHISHHSRYKRMYLVFSDFRLKLRFTQLFFLVLVNLCLERRITLLQFKNTFIG